MMRALTIGGLVILFFYCQKKTVPVISSQDNCTYNESKSYLLCIEPVEGAKNQPQALKYTISDKRGKEVFSGELRSGSVSWLDDRSVEIFEPPGMIREGATREDLKRVYVIGAEKPIPKNEYMRDQK